MCYKEIRITPKIKVSLLSAGTLSQTWDFIATANRSSQVLSIKTVEFYLSQAMTTDPPCPDSRPSRCVDLETPRTV